MALERLYNVTYQGNLADLPITLPGGSFFLAKDTKDAYGYDENGLPFLINDEECNCQDEIDDLSAQISEGFNATNQSIAILQQDYSQTKNRAAGIREANGNFRQPMFTRGDQSYGVEYAFGGEVFTRRYEITLTGAQVQTITEPFNFTFTNILEVKVPKILDAGGVSVYDSILSFERSLGIAAKVKITLSVLTQKAPGIVINSDGVSNYSGEKLYVDVFYTKP